MDEILKNLKEIGKQLNAIEIGRQRNSITVKVGEKSYTGKEFERHSRELRSLSDEIAKTVSWLQHHTGEDRQDDEGNYY
jgi:hypothetical protein